MAKQTRVPRRERIAGERRAAQERSERLRKRAAEQQRREAGQVQARSNGDGRDPRPRVVL